MPTVYMFYYLFIFAVNLHVIFDGMVANEMLVFIAL